MQNAKRPYLTDVCFFNRTRKKPLPIQKTRVQNENSAKNLHENTDLNRVNRRRDRDGLKTLSAETVQGRGTGAWGEKNANEKKNKQSEQTFDSRR